MAKYAKQQIRSNRIKRVTEGSYADLYHKEEEYERKKRQRIRELNRGAPQYNCRIKWWNKNRRKIKKKQKGTTI